MGNKSSKSNNNDSDNDDITVDSSSNSSRKSSQSYYTMLKNSYSALVNAIIRPPRCNYDINQLGPTVFNYCGKNFQRTDFDLYNKRSMKICCSLWEPIDEERSNPVLPCVIYMHGNSSARVEALSCLSLVLGVGSTLLTFDFCGSGLSEGDYVSLGEYEKDDLATVIEHLRNSNKTSTIALWGRSMGAATALLHGERDPSIAAMVLDSSFASLHMLAEEMVEHGRKQGLFAPGLLVKLAIRFIRSSVQRTAGFDIRKLAPIDYADRCFIPAMFIAAEGDHFVPPHHSQLIHDKYGGDKNIVIVDGDHNSQRPRFLFDSIGIFLTTTLQIPESWTVEGCQHYIRRYPWSSSRRNSTPAKSHNRQDEALASDYFDDGLSFEELLALGMLEEDSQDMYGVTDSDLDMQQNIQMRINDLLAGGYSAQEIENELEEQISQSEKRSSVGNSKCPTDSTTKNPQSNWGIASNNDETSKVPGKETARQENSYNYDLPAHPEADQNPTITHNSTFHGAFDNQFVAKQEPSPSKLPPRPPQSIRSQLMADSFIEDTTSPTDISSSTNNDQLYFINNMDKMISLSDIPMVDDYDDTPSQRGSIRGSPIVANAGRVGSPVALQALPQHEKLVARHSTFEKAFGSPTGVTNSQVARSSLGSGSSSTVTNDSLPPFPTQKALGPKHSTFDNAFNTNQYVSSDHSQVTETSTLTGIATHPSQDEVKNSTFHNVFDATESSNVTPFKSEINSDSSKLSLALLSADSNIGERWSCNVCTLENEALEYICHSCGTQRATH